MLIGYVWLSHLGDRRVRQGPGPQTKGIEKTGRGSPATKEKQTGSRMPTIQDTWPRIPRKDCVQRNMAHPREAETFILRRKITGLRLRVIFPHLTATTLA